VAGLCGGDACEQVTGNVFRQKRRDSVADDEHSICLRSGEDKIIGKCLEASAFPQSESAILVRVNEVSQRTTRDGF